MKYFNHITSLADLKKQYRLLAIKNHPDRGGSTEAMQEVNAEFEKLFDIWKDRKEVDLNGYENDFMDAKTSRQYEQHVWNEYGWTGSRCGQKNMWELAEEFRKFVKQAYPNCKFSITKQTGSMYLSYSIQLEQADFEAFTPEYKASKNFSGNVEWHNAKGYVTDRCREVMENVIDFVESFNYDHSNSMVDYSDVGFYTHYGIGTSKHHFKCEPLAIKGGKPEFVRKPTKHERLIQQAIGAGNCISEGKIHNQETGEYESDGHMWLMKDNDSDKMYGWPIHYSQPSLLKKRLDAMHAVGILTAENGRRYSRIEVIGYTPELQAALDKERAEEDAREAAFYAKANKSTTEKSKAAITQEKRQITASGEFEYIDYSERAFAVICDTKSIVPLLKQLGGSYNPRLSCGAGWIFPKSKEQAVRSAINLKSA